MNRIIFLFMLMLFPLTVNSIPVTKPPIPQIECAKSASCVCKNKKVCDLLDSKVKVMLIGANEKKVIWWGVNLRGRINYSITTKNGENHIDEAWWVVYPFGSIKDIGTLKDSGDIQIPDILNLAFGAKLVFRPKVATVVTVSDSVNLATEDFSNIYNLIW